MENLLNPNEVVRLGDGLYLRKDLPRAAADYVPADGELPPAPVIGNFHGNGAVGEAVPVRYEGEIIRDVPGIPEPTGEVVIPAPNEPVEESFVAPVAPVTGQDAKALAEVQKQTS